MSLIKINGVRLSYREFGNKNKHTIVFAHPLLFDSTVFDSLVPELANDFRIILLDIHGHGKSSYRSPLSLEEMTADYYELLKTLNFSRVTWVGYSIGGMIGMRLAVQHPQLVESLILMATSAQLDPPQIREQTGQLWQMFRDGHREDIVDAALQYFFAPATFLHQPDLVAKYRDKVLNYNQAQAEGMFEAARAVLDRADISEQISAINAPTLLIAGKEDLSPLPSELGLIASRIPHARLVVVNGASHLLAIEKPEQVSLIVKQFLHARPLGWQALGGHGEFRQTALDRPAHSVVGVR